MIGSRRILHPQSEDIWQYQVTPTGGYAHTPTITLYTGPYTPVWDWGDGSAPEAGVTMSHTYAAAGTYTVTVYCPAIAWWLKKVDMSTDKVSGDFLRTLLPMKRLTEVLAVTNPAINSNCGSFDIANWSLLSQCLLQGTGCLGSVAAWRLPTTLTQLRLDATSVIGDISGWTWPSGMTMIFLSGTGVTGSIAGWTIPAGVVYLILSSTGLSGAPILSSAVNLATFSYNDCALSQVTVDAILAAMYARRMSFTAASPTATLGGTNTDPGGVYQAANPPTTGLEYKHVLVNDDNAEGFKKWAITT